MRAIVSVVGKDTKGIIAKVSNILYQNDFNIEDISQTVMQDKFFTMIMLVTLENDANFASINDIMKKLALEIGVEINIRHEDIFNSMHRI